MNEKLGILFYLRTDHKNAKSGKLTIMVRITMNSKRVQFSSKLEIDSNDWDSQSQKGKGRSEEIKELNNTLDQIKSKIISNLKLFSEYNVKRTPENLRDSIVISNYFQNVKEAEEVDNSIYFIDAYRNSIVDKANTIGTLIEKITWDKYNRTFKKITEFVYQRFANAEESDEKGKFIKRERPKAIELDVQTKKGLKKASIDIIQSSEDDSTYIDIPIQYVDFKFVKDFETYLAVELKLEHNSKSKEMQNFQGFISFAMNMQWILRDPFHNIRITFVASKRTFLPEDDLSKIMNRTFAIKRLENVRDIFLFCCFTGYAFSDAMALTYDSIETINGKLWIIKDRLKTGIDENVPLSDIPLKIIDKYKQKSNGNLLPKISNQKMNGYLKEIADICGVNKELSTHVARHTFATLTLNNDVPIEVVSKLLGHTKLSTTSIYAKLLHKTIGDKMESFTSKIETSIGAYKTANN